LNIEKPYEILVRRQAALGDVIYTTGVVRELKRKYGSNANITVWTEFTDVFRNNPHVDRVFSTDDELPIAAFDMYFNLDNCYEYNPCNHYVDSYFYQVFGNHTFVRDTELFPTEQDRAAVDADLEYIGDKFVAVHMRQWHWELKNIKQEVWLDIFAKLFEATIDYKIVFVGGEADGAIDHPLMINTCGRYNPQELKYLLDHAACFVGIDSGPYAIATASAAPVVALLSHMKPSTIIPIRANRAGTKTQVVQADLPCVGCYERQARPISGIVCERGDFACNATWDTTAISTAILNNLKYEII
jgi:ADP-heptose:LPS heptosyltransferase